MLSKPLLLACGLSLAVQMVAVLIPSLRPTFRTDGVTTHDWIMVALASAVVLPAVELAKWIDRRRAAPAREPQEALA